MHRYTGGVRKQAKLAYSPCEFSEGRIQHSLGSVSTSGLPALFQRGIHHQRRLYCCSEIFSGNLETFAPAK